MAERSLTLEHLARRLERVERRHRRLQKGALGLVVLLAGAGLALAQRTPERFRSPITTANTIPGPPVEQRVAARQFTLLDSEDRERATLVADNAGSVFLTLMDTGSNLRAALAVMNSGPSLTFYDPDGQVRAVLGSTAQVASHVDDGEGNIERTPASSIVLFGPGGRVLWREP